MKSFRFATRSGLATTALAAAALVLVSAPGEASAAPPTSPATCLPHCDNSLYPFTEFAKASVETVLPVGPPTG